MKFREHAIYVICRPWEPYSKYRARRRPGENELAHGLFSTPYGHTFLLYGPPKPARNVFILFILLFKFMGKNFFLKPPRNVCMMVYESSAVKVFFAFTSGRKQFLQSVSWDMDLPSLKRLFGTNCNPFLAIKTRYRDCEVWSIDNLP